MRAVIAGILRFAARSLSPAPGHAHPRGQGPLVPDGPVPGGGAGPGGGDSGLAAAKRRLTTSRQIHPPTGLHLALTEDAALTLGGETVVLTAGHWRVIDEDTYGRIIALAFEHSVEIDRQSLRPAGDRLN